MEDYGILKAGSIVSRQYGYSSRSSYYEIVSFESEKNIEFNQYYAYNINAKQDKVIGAKELISFPKSRDYSRRGNIYYLVKKGDGELVVSKDLEDSLLIQQGTGILLKYEGEKPTYLMTKDEYKKYMKPIWEKVFDLPKKYPQYFYKQYDSYGEIETSEDYIFNIQNEYTIKYRTEDWVKKNKVEPKKPIPAELKKSLKEDFEDLRKITLNAYIGNDLKTNNKPIISKALEDGVYAELIKKGQLNIYTLKEILDSVKLKLPTKLEKAQAEVSVEGLTYEKDIENKDNLNKFKQDVISYFKKYYDKIRENSINNRTKTIKQYIEFSKTKSKFTNINALKIDFSDYSGIKYQVERNEKYKTTSYTFSGAINMFFNTRGLFNEDFILVNNWVEVVEKLATEEADYIFDIYVGNLIKQIPINIKSKLPKVVWGEIDNYSKVGFDSQLLLKFDNGFKLDVKNKTIYAGGYNIQQLHLRTIFNFSINDKVRSDEEIQKAYKEFVPVKEKEDVSGGSDKEYLESKLITSQNLLDLLNATQGDEKDIKHLEEMIQVTKDLINLI